MKRDNSSQICQSNCQIIELDLRTGDKNKLKPMNLAEDAINQKVEAAYGDVGLEVDVKNITNPEKFVDSYYRKNGYEVVPIQVTGASTTSDPFDETNKHAHNAKKEFNRRYNIRFQKLLEKGVPDFFVYNVTKDKEIGKMFFVEAKHNNDSMRSSQILWIFDKHDNIPVTLCFTNTEEADT